MTEERKQELTQLLQEALANLEIRPHNQLEGLSITIDQYKHHLKRAWSDYAKESLWIVEHFTFNIKREIESKFFEFLKAGPTSTFSINISEESVRKVYSTEPGFGGGFLNHILEIAMFQGIEKTVSYFEKSTNQMISDYKSIILLSGITSETKIQVFDGISLISLSYLTKNPTTELLYLPSNIINFDPYILNKMLMLVIDYSISPIFHNPSLLETTEIKRENKWDMEKERFRFEVKNREFSNFNEVDFHKKFCQALSLSCNSAVQTEAVSSYIAANKFSYINHNRKSYPYPLIGPPSADPIMIEKADIDKAKCLYEKLVNLNSKAAEKLQIAIDRWIKSKTSQTPEDKIIDLAIALEALYLPDANEATFKFAVRASWFLGKDREDRKKLFALFKQLYKCRSAVVHGGELKDKENVTIQEQTFPMFDFITECQNRCRDSIEEMMKQCSKDVKFPENDYWDSLVLGEESS